MVRVMIVTIVLVVIVIVVVLVIVFVVVIIVMIVIVIVVVRHWCVIGTRDRNLLAIAASCLYFSSGNENYQGF